jgi:tetratricopeptide (TPR) repeat protein/predicted HTH domain antitoxin
VKIPGNLPLRKTILPVVINFLFFAASLFSQENSVKPTRQSALDAFSKGNYEKALIQFKELSSDYPKDPLYKYYCGVTLVNLEKDPLSATEFLRQAQQESAAIKTIPNDASFFLGRAFQMCGNFGDAIKSYNQFTEQVGKKAAKERSTPQFIQQCNEKKGEFISTRKVNTGDTIAAKSDKRIIKAEILIKHESDTGSEIKNTLPDGYEKLLNDALTYQFRADSLFRVVDSLKQSTGNSSQADKQQYKANISSLEQLAMADQKLANENLAIAENLIHPKKIQNSDRSKKVIQDSVPPENTLIQPAKQNLPVVRADSSFAQKEKTPPKSNLQQSDSQIIKHTVNQTLTGTDVSKMQSNPIEVLSVFDIITNPVFSAGEKIPVNSEVEPGLIYRIQVAVFKNPVAAYYFKGITPVYGFKSEGSDITKYYVGMFRKSADASKALTRIRTSGFKDAIVVPMFDKKVISFERAAILEKEWSKKPFLTNSIKIADKQRDTVPSTLIFRVEVVKSPNPLPEDQLEKIRRLAGSRGLEIMINSIQQNVYLIGKFLTFESAAEYADLLVRNGQKEAKVAAYLGRKEIPVETAKQLFEKLE